MIMNAKSAMSPKIKFSTLVYLNVGIMTFNGHMVMFLVLSILCRIIFKMEEL